MSDQVWTAFVAVFWATWGFTFHGVLTQNAKERAREREFIQAAVAAEHDYTWADAEDAHHRRSAN